MIISVKCSAVYSCQNIAADLRSAAAEEAGGLMPLNFLSQSQRKQTETRPSTTEVGRRSGGEAGADAQYIGRASSQFNRKHRPAAAVCLCICQRQGRELNKNSSSVLLHVETCLVVNTTPSGLDTHTHTHSTSPWLIIFYLHHKKLNTILFSPFNEQWLRFLQMLIEWIEVGAFYLSVLCIYRVSQKCNPSSWVHVAIP